MGGADRRDLRRSEIVKEMDIKPESISKYHNNIYSKFDIHSRQKLLRLAETLDREWQVLLSLVTLIFYLDILG